MKNKNSLAPSIQSADTAVLFLAEQFKTDNCLEELCKSNRLSASNTGLDLISCAGAQTMLQEKLDSMEARRCKDQLGSEDLQLCWACRRQAGLQ